jgi:hypothetical protein
MAVHSFSKPEVAGIHAPGPAETLLIEQFRFWMSGHTTHQFNYLNQAWAALSKGLGVTSAKLIFSEIHVFTRILYDRSIRDIEWLFDLGRCISRDEGLMLALIHASQAEEPYLEIAAASELLGTFEIEILIDSSRAVAKALSTCSLILEPIESVKQLQPIGIDFSGRVLH